MRIHIKLTRDIYNFVREDLERPHEFAYERVGFLSARVGNADGDPLLIFLTDYHPIPDEHYIPDNTCGARINSTAIRAAMQRVLSNGNGAFHVHIHSHYANPAFSPIDQDEIPQVVSGLRNAGPDLAHGMLLLSDDHAIGDVWLPDAIKPTQASSVTVVGYPLSLFDRSDDATY